MIQIQITLFDKEGRYKPVSTLVTINDITQYRQQAKEIQKQGIIKICQKRGWTQRELRQYGYTTLKARVYNKEEINTMKR